MADKVSNSYKDSINIYDNIMAQKTWWGKLYMDVFWSGTNDNVVANHLLAHIPDDFCGTILDVPVGTAVFTYDKWKNLKNAKITCLDYSEDMLEKAKSRFDGCDHIACVQGDVGNLPLENESCDIVLSMNGFHVFPDVEKAYQEIDRVLKNDGVFLACFYVVGKNKLTDWLVKTILSKKGWFTPPFQTLEDVKETISKKYKTVELEVDGSMVIFKCSKT